MAEKYPGVSPVYTNQGGKESMIGDRGKALPITIDGSRLGTSLVNITVAGPSLYARRTVSPYGAVPFLQNAAIINPTNTTNATVDIADASAVKFKVGDTMTFYDVSAAAMSTQSKVISAIGAAGSGGVGETLITFTGVWSTAPAAGDLLAVQDGTELSVNCVVVLEDVVFDGSTDKAAAGFITGEFIKSALGNTTYFIQSENQSLLLKDVQA